MRTLPTPESQPVAWKSSTPMVCASMDEHSTSESTLRGPIMEVENHLSIKGTWFSKGPFYAIFINFSTFRDSSRECR